MKKLKLDELNRKTLEQFQEMEKHPIVVVLDNIRSGLNVGSVFRTCDAFAIQKVILTGITAKPPHKEINKTAIGATHSVEWEYSASIKEAILSLKKDSYHITAVEQTNQSIHLQEYELPNKPLALVFGNEVEGVSNEILEDIDSAIEVPQFGTKHSLNISVCAGIVIWDVFKKVNYVQAK